jgi:hypothetical protein
LAVRDGEEGAGEVDEERDECDISQVYKKLRIENAIGAAVGSDNYLTLLPCYDASEVKQACINFF